MFYLLSPQSIQVFLNVISKHSKIQLVDVVDILYQIAVHPAPKLGLLARPLPSVLVSKWGYSVRDGSKWLIFAQIWIILPFSPVRQVIFVFDHPGTADFWYFYPKLNHNLCS